MSSHYLSIMQLYPSHIPKHYHITLHTHSKRRFSHHLSIAVPLATLSLCLTDPCSHWSLVYTTLPFCPFLVHYIQLLVTKFSCLTNLCSRWNLICTILGFSSLLVHYIQFLKGEIISLPITQLCISCDGKFSAVLTRAEIGVLSVQ